MGKGNGTSRASSSSSPRGLTASQQNIVNVNNAVFSQNNVLTTSGGGDNAKILKAIDRAGFKSAGVNGQWELDTPYGGAQILDETDTGGRVFGYKEYGVSVWDKDYQMIEDGQERNAKRFNSLNEAKRYAKDLIKSRYE